MAFIDMAVGALNVTVGGAGSETSQMTASLRTSANANITTTGGAFALNIVPSGFGLNGNFGLAPFTLALLSYASGLSVIDITTQSTGLDRGTYSAELLFTPSGGDQQVAARGTVSVI